LHLFGTFLFPTLGISPTGYFPQAQETEAATAFAPGHWDGMLPLMKARLPKWK
jgi:hypothetical protein